jgi:hypothetical protein
VWKVEDPPAGGARHTHNKNLVIIFNAKKARLGHGSWNSFTFGYNDVTPCTYNS